MVCLPLHDCTLTLPPQDGDGDIDCVIGDGNGALKYYENTGSASSPAFTEQTGSNNPFNGDRTDRTPTSTSNGYLAMPECFDVNGDSDTDCLVGGYHGHVTYFKHDGTTMLDTSKVLN